jgi:hypothetical protein
MKTSGKNQSETKKLIRAFAACVFLCAVLMAVLIGSLKVKSNSEYALNGTTPEYVTLPDSFDYFFVNY